MRLPLSLAAVLLMLVGCEQLRSDPSGMSRQDFITTMVELRRARKTTKAPAAYEAEKSRVLARHGTSAAALEEFVRVHGEDPTYMSAVWDSIANRLERPALDSASAPGATPDSIKVRLLRQDSIRRRAMQRDSIARRAAIQDTTGRLASPRDSAGTRIIPRH
jgi:hypothetical protein